MMSVVCRVGERLHCLILSFLTSACRAITLLFRLVIITCSFFKFCYYSVHWSDINIISILAFIIQFITYVQECFFLLTLTSHYIFLTFFHLISLVFFIMYHPSYSSPVLFKQICLFSLYYSSPPSILFFLSLSSLCNNIPICCLLFHPYVHPHV